MKIRSGLFIWAMVFAGLHGTSSGQILLTGMVADSASMEALADVNIVNKQTGHRTVSGFQGGFSLEAGETDTIIFSRVGYHTRKLPAKAVADVVIIFMKEELRMLRAVDIHDGMPSWLPEIPDESSWKNPTTGKTFTEAPGFQGIQTFGPGYVFKMPGSGFRKAARAKQKLQEVREENAMARSYIHLVNDPGWKGKVMNDYHLTEEEYYRILARFNEKNKDFLYRLELREVIPLLLAYYADAAKHKD